MISTTSVHMLTLNSLLKVTIILSHFIHAIFLVFMYSIIIFVRNLNCKKLFEIILYVLFSTETIRYECSKFFPIIGNL